MCVMVCSPMKVKWKEKWTNITDDENWFSMAWDMLSKLFKLLQLTFERRSVSSQWILSSALFQQIYSFESEIVRTK